MSELAPMREQVYTDPRPKEYFDRFQSAPGHANRTASTSSVDVSPRSTRHALRTRSIPTEKVPGARRVILAPNHFSFMDHFLMGCYIRARSASWPSRSSSRDR